MKNLHEKHTEKHILDILYQVGYGNITPVHAMNQILHLIEPTAEANANTVLGDGWRDVKKELPKITNFLVSDDVLFCSNGKVYFGHYHENGFFYDAKNLYAKTVKNVTAWRELPNPPAFT